MKKQCRQKKRPFGQRVANIGTWQNALGLLGLAAVIVNCALIGLSGQVTRLWPGLTTTQTIILIVTLEHIMLGLRSALKYVIIDCVVPLPPIDFNKNYYQT